MKKFFERVISLTIVICLCLAMLPAVTMEVSAYPAAKPLPELSGNQGQDVANIAFSQLGYAYSSGTIYGAWWNTVTNWGDYTYSAWCAMFACWCANKAGAGLNVAYDKNSAAVPNLLSWLSKNARVDLNFSSNPQPGDFIFFSNSIGGSAAHVAIVIEYHPSTNKVTFVGGNQSNKVTQWDVTWSMYGKYGEQYVKGYGRPNYSIVPIGPHTCNKGTYVYYEAAHPHYKCYQCSVCGKVWRNTAEPTKVSTCTTCVPKHVIDSTYANFLPLGTYPIVSGEISVYDEYGTKYSNRYISGPSDPCVIREIYTDGWCKVTYPSSVEASGNFTAYVPLTTFISSASPKTWISTGDYTSYKHSDMTSALSSVRTGDKCLLVNTSGELKQIIHPVEGWNYFMMGWIAEPKQIHSSVSALTLTLGGTSSQTIYAWSSGYYNGNTQLYFSRSNSNISCSWGDWENGKAPLVITANAEGTTTLTVGVRDSDTKTVLDSMTIAVTIKALSYSISYDANGGTGAPANQTKTYGTNLTLSSKIPTRFGYTFKGWTMFLPATTVGFLPGGTYTKDMGLTLYAVWEPATEIPANVTNRLMNTTIPFAGGSTYFSFTPEVTAKYHFESFLDDDTLIYIYDANGSTLAKDNDSGDGKNFLLNYQFSAGVTYYVEIQLTGSETGDVYFEVRRFYQVKYDANGGTEAPSAQEVMDFDSFDIASKSPIRDGYTFLGWATSSTATSATYQPGDSFKPNDDITLYAVWGKGCGNNHSYSYTVTKEPSLNVSGELVGTCTKCAETSMVVLPRINDTDYTPGQRWEATCTQGAVCQYTWNTTTYGNYCFDVVISGMRVHDGKYQVTKEPTVDETGTFTEICSVCSKVMNVEILPMLNKTDYSWGVLKFATCTETGVDCYVWNEMPCILHITTPAKGHSFGQVTVHAPAPGVQGYSEHTCSSCGFNEKFDYVDFQGISVSGSVTSYLNDGTVTVRLMQSGKAVYTTTASGKNAAYTFDVVEPGTYTLEIRKADHITRSFRIEVTDTNVVQDAKICPEGDVTGDGVVNIKDFQRLLRHVNKTNSLSGYTLSCGDVTGDGTCNIKDFQRLLRHVNKTNPLF